MKIDACIIVKNELYFIEKLVNNLSKFCDDIYITDTGSTDKTWEKLNDLTEEYSNLHIDQIEWNNNFSEARNHVWNKSKDSDYRFWCDASDDFSKELIDALIEFKNKEIDNSIPDVILLTRLYGDLKSAITSLSKNRNDIIWIDPIHECLNIPLHYYMDYYFDESCYLIHENIKFRNGYSDRNINIFFNLDANGYKFSSRNLFYYANENYWHGHYLIAYKLYELAIKNYDKDFEDQNFIDAFVFMYKCHLNINKDMHITDEIVRYGEYLYENNLKSQIFLYYFGEIYYSIKQYDNVIKMLEECLTFNDRDYSFKTIISDTVNLPYLYEMLYMSYDAIGNYELANKYNELSLELNPDADNLKYNKIYFSNKLNNTNNE